MSENIHQKKTSNDMHTAPNIGSGHSERPQETTISDPQKLLQDVGNLSSDETLYLQRTIGNNALLQMMQPSANATANSSIPSLKMSRTDENDTETPSAIGGTIERKPSITIQRKGGSSKSPKINKKIFILPRKPYMKRKGFFGRLFGADYSSEKTGDKLVELTDVKLSKKDITYYEGKLQGDTIKVKFEHTIDDPTQEQIIKIYAEDNKVDNPDLIDKHKGSARYILANQAFDLWEEDAKHKDGGKWVAAAIQKRNLELSNAVAKDAYYEGKIGRYKVRALKGNTADMKSDWEKVAASTPLFDKTKSPKEPNADDVKQGAIGDCYLMAALSSLAQQQPAAIEGMMADQGGRVAVRLYEVDQSDPSDHKFKPKYISVEKSVAKHHSGVDLYNKGGLWVSILEKAYAAGGFTGSEQKAATDPTKMENIAGGQTRFAFEVLTGKKSSYQLLESGPQMGDDNKFSTTEVTQWKGSTYWSRGKSQTVPWDANVIAEIKAIKSSPQPDDFTGLSIFGNVFTKKEEVNAWYDYLKNSPNPIEKMFEKQNDARKAHKDNQVTIQDFEQVFKKSNLDSGVSTAVVKYIKTNKLYPGELSATSGDYSQAQLDSFTTIKNALTQGKAVSISTYSKPSKTSQGTGHSGGESQVDGIVFGHAYSVLDVKENSDITGTGTGQLKILKVRNPWGSYGREYDFSKTLPSEAGKAVEKGDGNFWLDLRDLTRYFSGVHYSG